MLTNWSRLEIAGKPVDVFDPPGAKPRFGLVYLHTLGMSSLSEKEVYTNLLQKHNLACVCPFAGQSWWADRICSEFDPEMSPERYLLDNVLPFFKDRWGLAPRSIGLFGISMGGQGALRLAFKHAKLFPVVAGISSAVEYHELFGQGTPVDEMYDSKEQCRQDTAPMWVPPSGAPPHIYFCIDPADTQWHRGNDRLHEKLRALGVEHSCDLTTSAGGHSWEYFDFVAERVIEFLVKGLEEESLRLL